MCINQLVLKSVKIRKPGKIELRGFNRSPTIYVHMFMISLLGHRKILVTLIGVDSAALTAAVALPGKAILIFRNGLMKNQNKKTKM